MTILLFCSNCNAFAGEFIIKNGNLLCSKCALFEQEQEGNNK